VDAAHLLAALEAHRRGETYRGPLLMTRASYYRMDDAMAVSYRWQDAETMICPGLRLNMSEWQLGELRHGVANSGCLYVWMDRIALPQHTCGLQVTLLARMMAIYATCRKTLALRALEEEGSRYHQRAWILQEYCNARELVVVTQPSDTERGLDSVAPQEEAYFPEIRAWHQARAEQCSPFWLCGNGLGSMDENIRSGLDKYQELSGKLICKYPADKVRALYPLLFNIPCEDHRDLARLVQRVAGIAKQVLRGGVLEEAERGAGVLEDALMRAGPSNSIQNLRAYPRVQPYEQLYNGHPDTEDR